jgi:hypothetical protein
MKSNCEFYVGDMVVFNDDFIAQHGQPMLLLLIHRVHKGCD